jgi:hypothetical protein
MNYKQYLPKNLLYLDPILNDITYTESDEDQDAADNWVNHLKTLGGIQVSEIANRVNKDKKEIDEFIADISDDEDLLELEEKIYCGLYWILDQKGLLK